MVFTDRQNKIYRRLFLITSTRAGEPITYPEDIIISKAYAELTFDRDFGSTIRKMLLELEELSKEYHEGLTPRVRVLYDDLVKIYGSDLQNKLSKEDNQDSHISNAPTEEEKDKGSRYINNAYQFFKGWVIPFINISLILVVMVVVSIEDLLPGLKEKLGDFLYWTVLILSLFLMFAWLIFSENLSRGRRKRK